jgi:hypothetical protein
MQFKLDTPRRSQRNVIDFSGQLFYIPWDAGEEMVVEWAIMPANCRI